MLVQRSEDPQFSIFNFGTPTAAFLATLQAACEQSGASYFLAETQPSDTLATFQVPETLSALFVLSDPRVGPDFPSLLSNHPSRTPSWLVATCNSSQRRQAFVSGFTQIVPPDASREELEAYLGAIASSFKPELLLGGFSDLARVVSVELSGPLHSLGLGTRAMIQELDVLSPFFEDLHKCSFDNDHDLTEKLVNLLSVINLKGSLGALKQTLSDHSDDLSRVQDLQTFLFSGSRIGENQGGSLSVSDLMYSSLELLQENRGDGIAIEIELGTISENQVSSGLLLLGMVGFFARLVECIHESVGGRGRIRVSDMQTAPGKRNFAVRVQVIAESLTLLTAPDISRSQSLLKALGLYCVKKSADPLVYEISFPFIAGVES